MIQDHASPVRPRSTSELLDVPAAMSSHSLAPGDASSRLPVAVASPEALRSCWTSRQPCQAIHSLQGTQVRDCPWPSRVQGLQEVEELLHISVLCCSVNAVHSRLTYGFKDSSTLPNLSEKKKKKFE